jgi:hypothetical protein
MKRTWTIVGVGADHSATLSHEQAAVYREALSEMQRRVILIVLALRDRPDLSGDAAPASLN